MLKKNRKNVQTWNRRLKTNKTGLLKRITEKKINNHQNKRPKINLANGILGYMKGVGGRGDGGTGGGEIKADRLGAMRFSSCLFLFVTSHLAFFSWLSLPPNSEPLTYVYMWTKC